MPEINNLTFYNNKLEKGKQNKPKANRRKKIIKAEIN